MPTGQPNRRSVLKAIAIVLAAPVSSLASALRLSAKDKTPLPPDVDVGAAGPLVGHTTPTSSSIWMYTPQDAKVELVCTAQHADSRVETCQIKPIGTRGMELRGSAWRAEITGLAPETQYDYHVTIDGQTAPELKGAFRTPVADGSPTRFRLGLTSCMVVKYPQTSWELFYNDKPDFHLTLGDTVYADSTDPRVQWRYHLRYRRVPEFAKVIRNMPTYALWDDHDYGPDNSDGTAKGKEMSLEGWKRVWCNPPLGTNKIPGAFFKLTRGDVDFFVVDGRYHRSPNKARDDENKTMFGKAQFNWLLDGLKQSKAKFKIIATGSTLHHSLNDGMRKYQTELHRLFDAIKEHRIDGVVAMTGSLHNSLVWEHHDSSRVGYPFVEIISSGIANSKTLSYATIDFDTTVDDPTMRVRIVAGTGKVRDEKTYKLSQLSHG